MSNILNDYLNPKLPGSFSGVSGFLKNNPNYKNNKRVRKTLKTIPSNTLHKQIKYKFDRSKTIVSGIDDQWQIDLIDLTNLSGSNSNYKFIFTCIDVFSKKAWAIPIINKSAQSCKNAFEIILKDKRKPKYVYADSGNEFKGEFLKYLKSIKIDIYLTKSKQKASVIERFNRTLKEKMFRYFEYQKTTSKSNLHNKRYIDVLPKLLQSYNNSFHRSIKSTPNNVNDVNESQIYYNLYGFYKNNGDDRLVKLKFKQGDYVRVVKTKSIFEKGYTAKWIDKIFIISKIILKHPILYELNQIDNNKITPVDGQFYTEELQKVELQFDTYIIEKELPDNKILIKQLNTSDTLSKVVDKTDFIANRLRSKNK